MSGHVKSVCLFCRWRQRIDLLVKRIAKNPRRVVVEPQARDNSDFVPKLAISGDADAASGQAYDVLTPPKTARGNSVNHQFAAIGQVNENAPLACNIFLHQTLHLTENISVSQPYPAVQNIGDNLS